MPNKTINSSKGTYALRIEKKHANYSIKSMDGGMSHQDNSIKNSDDIRICECDSMA